MPNQIIKIAASKDGRTRVYPESVKPEFEFVYRAAAGVYWNTGLQCFESSNPDNWDNWNHPAWFRHILATVRSELGEELTLTIDTRFERNIANHEDQIRQEHAKCRN